MKPVSNLPNNICHFNSFIFVACRNGRTRMVNERVEYTSNGSAIVSGRLEICISRDWVSVCDDETLSKPLADIACNSIGNGFNSKLTRLFLSFKMYHYSTLLCPLFQVVSSSHLIHHCMVPVIEYTLTLPVNMTMGVHQYMIV